MYKQGEGGCYGAQAKRGGNVMILLIDNYDSFSYNLFQLVGTINEDIKVIRNDEMSVDEIRSEMKILGVCLGHQSICEAYGGVVGYAKNLMHGKQSRCEVDNTSKLFKGLPNTIDVARYHSLSADEGALPDCLKITAKTDDGEIMALEHKEYNVFGVQFHPESIMTPNGIDILRNFLEV